MRTYSDVSKRAKELLSAPVSEEELKKRASAIKEQNAPKSGVALDIASAHVDVYLSFQKRLREIKRKVAEKLLSEEEAKMRIQLACNVFTQAFID